MAAASIGAIPVVVRSHGIGRVVSSLPQFLYNPIISYPISSTFSTVINRWISEIGTPM